MNRSLRIRLLCATSIASAAILTLLGIAVYASMWKLLMSDYDAALLAKARVIAATSEQRNGRVKIEFDASQMPEFSSRQHPEFFQIWQDDGRVLCRSDSLEGTDLPATSVAASQLSGKLILPHSHHVRAVVLTFTPPADEESEGSEHLADSRVRSCTMTLAGTPTDAREMLSHLGWLLCGLCALAIVVSGALLLRVV